MSGNFWGNGRKQSAPADSSRGTFYPHQQQQQQHYPQPPPQQRSNPDNPYKGSSGYGNGYQPAQDNPYAQAPASNRSRDPYASQRGKDEVHAQGTFYPHQQQQQQYPSANRSQQQYSNTPRKQSPYQTYNSSPSSSPDPYRQQARSNGPANPPPEQYYQPEPQQPQAQGRNISIVSTSSSGLWNKFKSQVSLSSTSFGFAKDHDGDTDDDTLIANSLVKFYTENPNSPGEIPNWLLDTKAARHYHRSRNSSVSTSSSSSSSTSGREQYQSPQLQQYYAQRQQQGTGSRQKSTAGASSLQEIYRKNSIAAESGASTYTSGRPPIVPSAAPKPSWTSNFTGRNNAPPPASVSNTPTANKMRDRLKSARPSLEVASNPPPSSATPSWRNKATW